jgi:hypothetical protein
MKVQGALAAARWRAQRLAPAPGSRPVGRTPARVDADPETTRA